MNAAAAYDYPAGLARHRPYLALPREDDAIAYVNIARCACRAMRVAMCNIRADGRLIDWLPRGAERPQYYRICYGDTASLRARARRMPTFTFVRNPYDRLLSFYLRNRANIVDGWYVTAGIGDGYDPVRDAPLTLQDHFTAFVQRLVRIPYRELDNHAMPQNLFLRDRAGVFVDFIGRLEQVGEQWRTVEEMAGRSIPLLHIVEERAVDAERPRYTAETRRLVYEYYRSDFEILGYDGGPEAADAPVPEVTAGYRLPAEQARALALEVAARGRPAN